MHFDFKARSMTPKRKNSFSGALVSDNNMHEEGIEGGDLGCLAMKH
jgi:hypothetical protein